MEADTCALCEVRPETKETRYVHSALRAGDEETVEHEAYSTKLLCTLPTQPCRLKFIKIKTPCFKEENN